MGEHTIRYVYKFVYTYTLHNKPHAHTACSASFKSFHIKQIHPPSLSLAQIRFRDLVDWVYLLSFLRSLHPRQPCIRRRYFSISVSDRSRPYVFHSNPKLGLEITDLLLKFLPLPTMIRRDLE